MDFRDRGIIDQLLNEGRTEEALELVNQSEGLDTKLGKGKNLDALKQIANDLNYKDVVQDELYKTKPNFKLIGEPTETAFSQVADDMGKGKDLVVRQADDIVAGAKPITDLVKSSGNPLSYIDDAILTSGRSIPPGMGSRVLDAGKKGLGVLGRGLVPGLGMMANAAAAMDQPEANGVANVEQQLIEAPGFADKAMGVMKAAEESNKEMDKMFYDLSNPDEQHKLIDDVEIDAKNRDVASIKKKSDFVKQNIAILNEEIQKPGRNEKELADAIEARDSMIKTTMMMEGIAEMLSGLGNMSSGVMTKPINLNLQAMRDLASDKVADVDKKRLAREKDPSSEESIAVRAALKKAGVNVPDNLNAETAMKMFPQLVSLQTRDEDREARKEMMALKREELGQNRDTNNKFKSQGSVDRQVQNLQKSVDLQLYRGADQASTLLEQAMSGKGGVDKTQAGAAFMNYAKVAQNDASVVRESDMQTLAGNLNYKNPAEMLAKMSSRAAGGEFTPKEMKNMIKIIGTIKGIKKQQVSQQLSPIVKRSEAHGLDLSESLDPSFVREFSQAEPSKKAPASAQTTASDMVRVKSPTGKSKLVPRSQLKAALAAGGTLEE